MSPLAIDLLVVAFVALGVIAEVRRGLFLALFDAVRVVTGIALGLLGYSLVWRLGRNATAGMVGFVIAALAAVWLAEASVRRSGLDPRWGKRAAARVLAGGLGILLGLSICQFLVPVLGRTVVFEAPVARSILAQPFLDQMPSVYLAADRLNIGLPQINRRAVRFEDESMANAGAYSERINYLRLNGSTCIECRSPVEFRGYRRRRMAVSPIFACPRCGRTSDGCQTFEGFHRMYERCPHQVAVGGIEIDCGVWPNGRPVRPRGICPVDSLAGSEQ